MRSNQASAVNVQASAASLQASTKTDSPSKDRQAVISHAASYVVPDTEAAMSWRIGDSGFIMSLAKNVPDLIQTNLPPFHRKLALDNNLSVTEIKGWAVHPGGPRILDAVADALQLHPEALSTSRQILSECGNMSSPDGPVHPATITSTR